MKSNVSLALLGPNDPLNPSSSALQVVQQPGKAHLTCSANTLVLLADPNQPIKPDNFPETAQELVLVVLARYRARKATSTEAEKPVQKSKIEQERDAIFEKAIHKPETLKEWFIYSLHHNRTQIKQITGAKTTNSKVIEAAYGYFNQNLVFNEPAENFKKRLETGVSSDLDNFAVQYLKQFIHETTKLANSGNYTQIIADTRNTLAHHHISHSAGKVSLEQFIHSIVTGLAQHAVSKHLNSEKARNQVLDMERRAGKYLFASLIRYDLNEGEYDVDTIVRNLIDLLLPPKEEITTKGPENPISALDSLTNLQSQIEILMKRLAIKGEINRALENLLFPDQRITKFHVQYQATPRFFTLGKTKSELHSELESRVIPHVQKELAVIYQMLSFAANCYTRAKLLIETAKNDRQKAEGNLILEMVGIYNEFLSHLAIETEAKIRTGELEIPDLSGIVEIMMQFGGSGEKTLNILKTALQEKDIAQATVKEV